MTSKIRYNYCLTKQQLLEDLSALLASFYGASTTVGWRIKALPKADVSRLHEVAWLNRNDPLPEQINILEAHMRNYLP